MDARHEGSARDDQVRDGNWKIREGRRASSAPPTAAVWVEVEPSHLCERVLIREIHSPDAGASADVDNILQVVADGSEEQPVAHRQ